MAVERLTADERDRQADYLKYYLYDQRARATALLERRAELADGLDGAWPSDTGLDPDMVKVVKALTAEGRHVPHIIRRVDAEPPTVLNMLGMVSPYPASHWRGWRTALMSLPPRRNHAIAMTVLDYYPDDFAARALGVKDAYLVTEARREGLRQMVVFLHNARLRS